MVKFESRAASITNCSVLFICFFVCFVILGLSALICRRLLFTCVLIMCTCVCVCVAIASIIIMVRVNCVGFLYQVQQYFVCGNIQQQQQL